MKTRNEKILLAILVTILFGGGNYYGYLWLAHRQAALTLTYAQLQADQKDAELDLQDEDLATQRKTWIQANEPAMGEEGDTKAEVLNVAVKGASDNKLEIVEQSLGAVERGPAGARVNVTLKIKGSMEGLAHWLADLQKPGSFYAVSISSLQADQDMKSMQCQLQIARYFKEGP